MKKLLNTGLKREIPKEILDKINTQHYELFDKYGPLHPEDFGSETNKIMYDLTDKGLKLLKELGYYD